MLKSTFGLFSPCLRADAQLLDAPAASVPDATPEHAGREGEVGDRDRGGGLGDQRGLPPEAARHRECGHLGGESAVSECMQRAEIILFDGVYTEKRQKPTSYKLCIYRVYGRTRQNVILAQNVAVAIMARYAVYPITHLSFTSL